MSDKTLPKQQRVSHLLGDAAQVAIIRDLIVHARKVRAEHGIYPGGRSTSGAVWPAEHTWTAGPARVLVHDGWLIYLRHGSPLLKARVVDARQVGQLLAAIGVVPQRFITSSAPAKPTNPDRRCRYCGATSGLKMLHRSPLAPAAREWQCWDDCKDSAR